jgi:polyisoprenoid-binding protein YceI
MKHSSLALAFSFSLVLAGACRESVVDTTPPAQVTETATATSATTETVATSTQPTPGATVGNVIKEKSKIEWVGAKVTRDHDGSFKNFDGYIEYSAAKPSRIAFDIDLNSIVSDEEKLTGHLKSPDFFDVARYPRATFVSSAIAEAPAGTTTHSVKGTLNMHGVEKEVTIPVKTTVSKDGVRTQSDFTINRHDWGISYKGAADDLIKDNVLIKLDLMFPPPPAA